jgi:hypothetical protein
MNVAMIAAPKSWFVVLIVVIIGTAAPGWARERSSFRDMLDPDSNERGFTIGGLLEMNIRQLARSPLSPETLSRVSDDVHRPPHRGVQLELLCPGDIGATIHFRW